MKRTVVIPLAVAVCACLESAVHAHHSHPAFYDFCKRVTVEGRIDSVEWKDPHTQIRLALDDGTAYRVEWSSPRVLERQGVGEAAQQALTFGARIVVLGNPQRDPEQIRARFPNVTVSTNPPAVDPLQIRRVDDTWSWALPPRPNPLPCDEK
jgi:hypothetical protein